MIKVSLLDGRACLGGWRYGMVPRFSNEYSQRSRRSSVVERALGKGEVGSSILPGGTISRFPSARYRRRIDDPPQAIAEIGLAGRRVARRQSSATSQTAPSDSVRLTISTACPRQRSACRATQSHNRMADFGQPCAARH
jgi:hypothetical protein